MSIDLRFFLILQRVKCQMVVKPKRATWLSIMHFDDEFGKSIFSYNADRYMEISTDTNLAFRLFYHSSSLKVFHRWTMAPLSLFELCTWFPLIDGHTQKYNYKKWVCVAITIVTQDGDGSNGYNSHIPYNLIES